MAGNFLPASFRRPALALVAAAAFAFPLTAQAQRGPDKISDVAEAVIDAVVNISTSQTVGSNSSSSRQREGQGGGDQQARPGPNLPPGSPFEEFFEEFFKNRRGGPGEPKGGDRSTRTRSGSASG